ncbi:hypothetical protein G9C98_007391 [Cotesia typhae]|uniref:Uncharacterized protein n=1 Tax=Cotesia typhae TaxID=2053667 RepID=A0A8J5QUS2_9HYME|nr:hypothetical protein G9C98_007391 [Cotesia typhae]
MPLINLLLYPKYLKFSKILLTEDYYGDLDLKSIRKSELLAGISGNGQSNAPKSQGKPRPTPSRPQPIQE